MKLKEYIKKVLKETPDSSIVVNFDIGVDADMTINDKNKLLKFVVCKGFVDDWCVYLESMETEQTHAEVKILGNKISPTKAELLVACDYKTMERYRI